MQSVGANRRTTQRETALEHYSNMHLYTVDANVSLALRRLWCEYVRDRRSWDCRDA
jgi:hypothetical protein